MKNFIKELIPYVIIIVVVVLIRMFIVTPVQVDGNSMYPTLKDNEILLLKKYDQKYKRFDIVVLNYNNSKLIKRIIGLPGEHIEYKDNKLYVNGKYVKERFKRNTETSDFEIDKKIPKGYYFVMGDNRGNSLDSRDYRVGLVKKEDIVGVTIFRLYPFNKIGTIK